MRFVVSWIISFGWHNACPIRPRGIPNRFRLWHIADSLSRLAARPLFGVRRTLPKSQRLESAGLGGCGCQQPYRTSPCANVGLSVDNDRYAVVNRPLRPGQLTEPDA